MLNIGLGFHFLHDSNKEYIDKIEACSLFKNQLAKVNFSGFFLGFEYHNRKNSCFSRDNKWNR